MKKILIVGATSSIATEVARTFAMEGAELFLAARNEEALATLSADLKVRGASSVATAAFDALNETSHVNLVQTALTTLGSLDAALIAHGVLPDQKRCQEFWPECHDAMIVNFLSPMQLLTVLATYFEERKTGNIAVISSVAGDRGRQSNYVYGAAKGGLTVFLQGLRNRLAHSGVSVTTIKPGFVDTPMTSHLRKNQLFASPQHVGARIHRAMKNGESVVYTPWFWRWIMLIIQHIPECLFKKMRL
jgi:decaprenylphospho-beta-D-erythro-pentofuranosid-2-ulose 2-reductase